MGMNQPGSNLNNQRIPNMNHLSGIGNGPNSSSQMQLQNQLHASNSNKNLLNLQQQQLQSGMNQLNSNLIGSLNGLNNNNLNGLSNSNNTSNNLLGLAGFNTNSNSSSSSSAANGNNLAQTQAQLIESYRVAVQLGLVTPDLLNIKLPPDVLALIYQLFQTLSQFTASTNKMNQLASRRSQLPPQQYKTELDILSAESQAQKDSINMLKAKINQAHMILKQQQQGKMNSNSLSNSFSGNNSNNILGSQTSPLGNLGGSQNALVNSLGSLSLSNDMVNSLAGVNDSKLLKLLGDSANQNKFGGQNNNLINRQNSLQQGNKQNSFFGQSLSSNSATPSLNQQNQWGGPTGGLFDQQNSGLDDRITPFIPGQLWTGGQNAEDDPNCTPGSFSKPLLTETIDPESILNSLQRSGGSSQWPNSLDLGLLGQGLLNNNGGLGGNNGNRSSGNNSNRMNMNNNGNNNSSWSSSSSNSNNQFMSQLSVQNQNLLSGGGGAGNSSIGEQLWGVRSSNGNNGNNNNNRSNNGGNNNNSGNLLGNQGGASLNRNASSFGNNSLMNQQQQQNFFRSNSWNIAGGQQQLGSSGDGRNSSQNMNNFNMSSNINNGVSINGGHFLLIKNITPQVMKNLEII
jgi:hypothetical protein